MFNNLIETNAKRQRSIGGTLMSFLLHGGLQAAEDATPPGHIDATPQPR